MRFGVFLQTGTTKTANGDRHAMLKVIQHGMRSPREQRKH
jgi:hypothetical protein